MAGGNMTNDIVWKKIFMVCYLPKPSIEWLQGNDIGQKYKERSYFGVWFHGCRLEE